MRKLLAILLVLLPGVAVGQVRMHLLNPTAGTILHPGDQVKVEWTVLTPSAKGACEQELMLSLDGGRSNSIRMSRMLSPNLRKILWTIPDVASQQAVIDVRYGCNGNVVEPSVDVPQYPQVQAQFTIERDPLSQPESVVVLPFATATVAPGRSVTVAWKSTVGGVDEYELMVSFDRGAHFYSAGRPRGASHLAFLSLRDARVDPRVDLRGVGASGSTIRSAPTS